MDRLEFETACEICQMNLNRASAWGGNRRMPFGARLLPLTNWISVVRLVACGVAVGLAGIYKSADQQLSEPELE